MINGAIGLTKSINQKESAMQDLSVMERIDSRVQQDRAMEVQAQQQEALFYERMYTTADGMLEKDRKKINHQIMMKQKQVREHLGRTGGSKKDFMAGGGLSVMNGITNDIIRSPEAVTYQENKANLAKILELKEKKMGHLLTPRDLKALEDYDKNPNGGVITYSGVMAEVEIPPSLLFDYGTEIPPEKVMSYDANMIKIMGNYKMSYPDLPEPDMKTYQGKAQIVAFMKEMGYGGYGSNTVRAQEAAALAKARADAKAKDPQNPDAKKSTMINGMFQAAIAVPKMTVADLEKFREKGGYVHNQINGEARNGNLAQVTGKPFRETSRRRGVSSIKRSGPLNVLDGVLEAVDYFSESEMVLREGYHVPVLGGDLNKVAAAMGMITDETGIIKGYTPSKEDYTVDGVQMTSNFFNVGDIKDYEDDYKVIGLSTVMESTMANHEDGGPGESVLLVDAIDKNGKYDENETKKLYGKNEKGELSSEVQMGYVIALRGQKAGDIIYKKVDLSHVSTAEALGNAMGANNNVTGTVEERRNSHEVAAKADTMTRDQQVAWESTKVELDKDVFSDPILKNEIVKYAQAGTGNQVNRLPLMKSFYTAYDLIENQYEGKPGTNKENITQMIDDQWFSVMMDAGGIGEDLKNYDTANKPEDMIRKWNEQMNSTVDPGSLQERVNNEVAAKWRQLLGLQ